MAGKCQGLLKKICSLSQFLLNIYCVPSIILGIGMQQRKIQFLPLGANSVVVEESDNNCVLSDSETFWELKRVKGKIKW